jgi:REP element-mobilizing transposase RayT
MYCQQHKHLKVYAFVFMLNHLHFIGKAEDLSTVIHDMKTFLSKELKKNIQLHEPNLLQILHTNGKFELWQKTNYPKLINSEKFFNQKIEYIHSNPVRKLYVHTPEDWRWSSASRLPTGIEISTLL